MLIKKKFQFYFDSVTSLYINFQLKIIPNNAWYVKTNQKNDYLCFARGLYFNTCIFFLDKQVEGRRKISECLLIAIFFLVLPKRKKLGHHPPYRKGSLYLNELCN